VRVRLLKEPQEAFSGLLADLLGTGDVEGVVEQRRHAFDEALRMRQGGVRTVRAGNRGGKPLYLVPPLRQDRPA